MATWTVGNKKLKISDIDYVNIIEEKKDNRKLKPQSVKFDSLVKGFDKDNPIDTYNYSVADIYSIVMRSGEIFKLNDLYNEEVFNQDETDTNMTNVKVNLSNKTEEEFMESLRKYEVEEIQVEEEDNASDIEALLSRINKDEEDSQEEKEQQLPANQVDPKVDEARMVLKKALKDMLNAAIDLL